MRKTCSAYASEIIRDTMHLRPSTEGTVRFVKATSNLGRVDLELTSTRTYACLVDARDDEAWDFLWRTCETLGRMTLDAPAKAA